MLSRRELLSMTARAGVGAFLGGCAVPLQTSTPAPFFHSEFSGRIGVARGDITPPVGIYARNWGAAKHDVAEGIHRPLTATILSFQAKEEPPLILAACDLGWWKTWEDEKFVRGKILETLSLDPSRVMINLSHTHTGPAICREDRDKPGGHLIEPYLARVRDVLAETAQKAVQSATRATLTWSHGRCDLARNRDLKDPARNRMVTGFNPGTSADDLMLVGRVADPKGKILATIVNYACHPTTLAWECRLISPDYPGAMRETIEAKTGGHCLYLHGPSGEVGPRDGYTGELEVADRNGRQLGYAVLSTLEGMLPAETQLEFAGVVESGAPLATWKRTPHPASSRAEAICVDVEYALKPLPSEEEIERQIQACEDRVMTERLRRKKRVRRMVGDKSTARIPLWVWRLGDAFLVGQPNESYSGLQAALRRRYPSHPIAVMNLVNGSIGYLPPAPHHDLDIYQVWQSPFDRGSFERLIEASGAAIARLGGA